MKDSKYVVNLTDICWCIIFTVFLLQNRLSREISWFRFADEILTIAMLMSTIRYIFLQNRFPKRFFRMYGLMLLLFLVGLISRANSDVTRSWSMVALDALYLFKVYICFMGAVLFFDRPGLKGRLLNLMALECSVIVWTAFVCLIISQYTDIKMMRGIRYGIPCFRFIYTSEGMFSQYCIIFLVILTADLAAEALTYRRIVTFGMLFIVWAATLRSRGFVIMAIWAFLMFMGRRINYRQVFSYNGSKDKKNRLVRKIFRPQNLAVMGITAWILAAGAWNNYFGESAVTARKLLLQGGIRIMKDYFPWGAGFATFGTEPAATYYSPLYYKYGLYEFWALKENGSELTDCYWPAVGGELGIIGLILMIVLVILFLKAMLVIAGGRKYYLIAVLTYIIYLVISSTATGIFASYITAEFVVIIAAVLLTQKIHGEEQK